MADVEPFATISDLEDRWPDMPPGSENHADILLLDASQMIVDLFPDAADGSVAENTLRRITCAVVRRAIEAADSDQSGFSQFNVTGGPFTVGGSVANPHGDLYLTRNERRALGQGRQRAFGVNVTGGTGTVQHRPWCSLTAFGANYCSCGADIAGSPIYEA